MIYYKIIKNNTIIDVNNELFCYLPKHKNIISCDKQMAQLIRTSDEKTFYTTEWLLPLPEWAPYYEKVEAIIISKQEYLQLKKDLEVQEIIEIKEDSKEEPEITIIKEETIETPQEQPMSATEMRKRIIELENLVKQLLKQ